MTSRLSCTVTYSLIVDGTPVYFNQHLAPTYDPISFEALTKRVTLFFNIDNRFGGNTYIGELKGLGDNSAL